MFENAARVPGSGAGDQTGASIAESRDTRYNDMSSRTVFFVSDRTGITVETLGHSLLTQFPNLPFKQVTLPFIDSVDKAHRAVEQINQATREAGAPSVVFSTLIEPDIRGIVAASDAVFFDFIDTYIEPLERAFGAASTHTVGRSHGMTDRALYGTRMEAVNFALSTDDGIVTKNYDIADVVITGVSRSGKTPTCLYLAMQFGLRAANYPLTDDASHRFAASSGTTTLTVLARPTVAKAVSPTQIETGGTSTLTITLSNSNSTAITGVAFTDTYPANLVNASTPAGSTTCAGGVVTAAAGGSSVVLSGGTIPASGSCTVMVSVTSSMAGTYTNSIAIGDVTSTNAGSNTVAASATLTVNSSVASFDAVEVGASPNTNLYTKLSGVNFTVDILALDSSNLVSSGYTGTVSLALVDASTGGGVCASMTSLQALGSMTLVAPDAGRKTTLSINYAGASRNARIRITDAALGITSCSFDAFAIRPTSLSVTSNMTNTGTSGTPFINAGGNFTLTATALAGYNGTPTIDNTKIAAHAGATQIGSIAGVFGAAVLATGVASGSTFTYSEVGNFQFLTQGVFDDTFTAVDQPNDCTSDFSNTLSGGKYGCKFANIASTAFFGRFTPDHFTVSGASLTNRNGLACSPASTFTYMNEPIGLAFTLNARNAAGGVTQNYTAASGFAKLDPTLPRYFNFVAKDTVLTSLPTFAISAITRSNPGQVTTAVNHGFVTGQQVYLTGVNGMTQLNGQVVTVTVVDTTNFTIGVDTTGYSVYASGGTVSRLAGLTSSGSWVAGSAAVSASVALKRAVAPDGPYTALNIGIAPRDDDGVALLTGLLNLDADNNASNDSYNAGTTETRFGRLRLNNTFGSSLLDLPLPLSTQYYDGNFFVTNTADSCTTLSASDIRFDFVAGTPNLVACETHLSPAGAITFASGQAAVRLTKPGNGNDGAVDLAVNLGAVASGNSCTSAASSAATAANKTWLRGNWGSGSYNDDPRGRATFGIFKNADQFLYFREVY